MKPSDVRLGSQFPLPGAFGKLELETAAAMLVLACRVADTWDPVTSFDIDYQRAAHFNALSWIRNPFAQPDYGHLVAAGFAEWSGLNSLSFTPAGLARLERFIQTTT